MLGLLGLNLLLRLEARRIGMSLMQRSLEWKLSWVVAKGGEEVGVQRGMEMTVTSQI